MKKFAIILSGCGVYDGSEIHETVMAMLAVDKSNSSYQLYAPNIQQHHTVNHLTGEVTNEVRNVLVESARIARGNIKSIDEFEIRNYDAIIFPGGFGVAKNLSNYAFNPNSIIILPSVEKIIKEAISVQKPIGAMCIAPILVAKLISNSQITIGNDQSTIEHINNWGSKHIVSVAEEVVVDKSHKIFTTPCYMLSSSIAQIAKSAENLVNAMLKVM